MKRPNIKDFSYGKYGFPRDSNQKAYRKAMEDYFDYLEAKFNNVDLADVSNRPTIGMIEMAIHDYCTTHNGKEE